MQNEMLADPTLAKLFSFRQPPCFCLSQRNWMAVAENLFLSMGSSHPFTPTHTPVLSAVYSPPGKKGLPFEMLVNFMVKAVSLLQESLCPDCNNPSLLLAIVLSDKVSPYPVQIPLSPRQRLLWGPRFCRGGGWALGGGMSRMGSSAHSEPRLAGSEPLPAALFMKCVLCPNSVLNMLSV